MKKAIQRILCLLTALTLCCSMPLISAAQETPAAGSMRCLGDVNGDGKANAVDARRLLQAAVGQYTVAKTDLPFADVNKDGKLNAIDARFVLQIASGMRPSEWYVYSQDGVYTPLPTYNCAEALRLVNDETAKIAQTGGYTVQADCSYVRNVKLSSSISTWILNQLIETIMQTVAPGTSMDLNTLFGMLVGVGTTDYTVEPPTGTYTRAQGQYDIIPMTLQESDVVAYRQDGTKLYFTLQNTSNPVKNGAGTLGHMTGSFHEQAEYMELFAQAGEMATVNKFEQSVTGTVLCVNVADGKITAMEMQYDDAYAFDAVLDTASLTSPALGSLTKVPVKGTATTRTATQYSNIVY